MYPISLDSQETVFLPDVSGPHSDGAVIELYNRSYFEKSLDQEGTAVGVSLSANPEFGIENNTVKIAVEGSSLYFVLETCTHELIHIESPTGNTLEDHQRINEEYGWGEKDILGVNITGPEFYPWELDRRCLRITDEVLL